MKIEEFKIIKYGPLHDYGKTKLQNFTLFFGENEDGKTLAIDALTKFMFGGKEIREFDSINRVDEKPEGYVAIRDSKGKLKKIERGSFKKNYNLTSSECRNIFIIRNSDLSIASEGKFYDSVGARLMGLRTGELTNVKASLRAIGQVTPSNNFRNDISERMDASRILLESIDELILGIEKEDLDKLETENIELSNESENVEQKTKLLEDASKRETYEKGNKALTKLEEDAQNLQQFEPFNETEEQTWRYAQRDIETQTKAKEKAQKDLEINKNPLIQKTEELRKAQQKLAELNAAKQKLNEEVRPKLVEYQTKRSMVAEQRGKSNFFTALSAFSAIMLLATITGIIVSPSLILYSLTIGSILLLAVSLATKLKYTSNEAQLMRLLDTIKLSASKYNLGGQNIEEMLSKIQGFDLEYEVKSGELTGLTTQKQILEGKVNELQNDTIPDIDRKLDALDKQIETIIGKSGVASLDKYSDSLKQRKELEKSVEQQETILGSIFETELNKREEKLAFWEKEIEELEGFRDKSKETKYSARTLTELRTRQSQIESRQNEISEKLAKAKEDMKEIERRASEVLRSGECMKCETNTDLKAIRNSIVGFVENSENSRNDVLEALNIFQEIENEEKNKVSTLFGEDSKVSEYFKEITNGLYKAVRLNPEEQAILVERNDGESFDAEQLSAGTYDQLYLSIRLALGEKLLKGEKAFFIMDDPFIKSDRKRLERQMNILTKISQSGWQILYFSAKDEVRDVLKDSIEKGNVNLVETRAVAR